MLSLFWLENTKDIICKFYLRTLKHENDCSPIEATSRQHYEYDEN